MTGSWGGGDAPERFDTVLDGLDAWLVPGGVPGVGACLWHRGEVVAERYVGEASPYRTIDRDSLFALASVSKPVTATTLMTLVEDGAIHLDESVASILPEFSAPTAPGADPALEARRGEITIRHLLCHTSGLPEDIGRRESRYGGGLGLAELTGAMCRLPLKSAPGEQVRYSNAGYAVLALAAERRTGEEFWSLTRSRVLDPLGLDDIVARPEGAALDRLALVQDPPGLGSAIESYNSPYWRMLAIPWGGYFGTPRAVVEFAATFLPGYGGMRPLAGTTIALMREDQTGGVPGGVESGRVWWPVARWGLGWEIKGEKTNHWTGRLTSPATICHFGQTGTLVWADPSRDLALAVFTNRAVTRMWTFILRHWIELNDRIVRAADALAAR